MVIWFCLKACHVSPMFPQAVLTVVEIWARSFLLGLHSPLQAYELLPSTIVDSVSCEKIDENKAH
jgi:hypothetical protein